MVAPKARPRRPSRNMIQPIDVSARICESCQVFRISMPKPNTSRGRGPIRSYRRPATMVAMPPVMAIGSRISPVLKAVWPRRNCR